MKRNPCRNCLLSCERNKKHYPSWRKECFECENRKRHKEYLESNRKFSEGETITTLEERLKQDWVMWYHNTKHIEVIKCNQLRTVLYWLKVGAFKKAIRKESEVN